MFFILLFQVQFVLFYVLLFYIKYLLTVLYRATNVIILICFIFDRGFVVVCAVFNVLV